MARGGSLGTISVDLEARIAKFESDIGRAARLLEREMSRSAKQSERAITEMRKSVEREMQSVRRTMEQTRTIVAGIFSFQLGSRFAGLIRQYNDGFIGIQAQLRQTTSSQKALTAATQETFKIAQRTYASFESTGLLVGRTARALQSAGRDHKVALQESLRFSEAINNAFILSGAKAIEAKNAILQLSQGLASGTLRGDEYRSVAEQGAKVIEIMAKNLTEVDGALQLANGRMGVTSGRLRELAYEGKLTTDLVVGAMLAGFNELALGVGDIPLTIERAFTRLSNAAENYVGTSTGIAAFNLGLAKTISAVADNFEILADAALLAAAALVVVVAGRSIRNIADFARSLSVAAEARRADAAAAVEQARAGQLAAERQIRQTISTRDAAKSMYEVSVAEAAATKATVDRTRALILQIDAQQTLARGLGRTTLANMLQTAGLTERLTDLERAHAGQLLVVGQRREEMIRQNALYSSGQKDVAGTTSRTAMALKEMQKQAATALATMSRLGAGFLSLIGGWPTVLLGAAYGLYELFSWMKKTDEQTIKGVIALEAYTERLRERVRLEDELRKLPPGATEEDAGGLADYREAQKEVQKLQEQQDKLQLSIAHVMSTSEGMFGPMQSELERTGLKLTDARNRVTEFEVAAAQAGIMIPGSMEPVIVTAGNAALAFAQLTGHVADLNAQVMNGALFSDQGAKYLESLHDQIATIGMSRDMLLVYTASRKAATESDEMARKQIIDTALALAERIRQEEASKNATKEGTKAKREEQKVIRDALRDHRSREKALRDETTALRSLESITRRYSSALSGPLERAMEVNVRLQEQINRLMNELLESGPPAIEIHERIAEALTLVNAQMAKNVAAAEKDSDVRGRTISELDREIKVLSMSNRERQVYEVMERAIEEARRDKLKLDPAYMASLEAEVRQRMRLIEVMEQQQAYKQIITDGAQAMASAIADFATGSADNFESFTDSIVKSAKDMVKQVLSEFLKLKFINPALNAMLGLSLPTGGSISGGGGKGWISAVMSMFGGSQGQSGASGGGFSGWMSTVLSMFGGGGSTGSGAGAGWISSLFGGGGTATGTGLWSTIGSYFGTGTGAATGTASGAAGGAGGAGAGASAAAVAAGWIVAGMIANEAAYAGGWRGNSPDGPGPELNSAMAMPGGPQTGDKILQGLGLNERWASLISGSALHTRLWGRRQPVMTGSNTSYTVGPEGAGGSSVLDIYRRGGYFRSSRRSQETVGLTEEGMTAAQDIFNDLTSVVREGARRMQAEAPELLNMAMRVVQEMDNKGRLQATKFFVDSLGSTREVADQEEAMARMQSEAIIHMIDQIMGGVTDEATAIAEKWRRSTESLVLGAEFLLVVASDIRNGMDLLGTSTLTPIVALVEELSIRGESLIDTYARIYGSTKLLEDALEMSAVSVQFVGEEFVRFAAEMVEVAGGLERAERLWSSYYDTFFTATERTQMELQRSSAAVRLAAPEIGLDADALLGPGGAAAFRAAFTASMPTLSPAEMVTWLEFGESLARAYTAQVQFAQSVDGSLEAVGRLVEAAFAYAQFSQDLQTQVDRLGSSEFVNGVRDIGMELRANENQLRDLAEAAGMSAPRIEDMAAAAELAGRKLASAIQALRSASTELVVDLYGTPLSRLEQEIAAMELAANSASTGVVNAASAIETFVDRTRRAVEDLLLDDSLSPLGDREKLQLALERTGQTGSEQDARTTLQIGRRLMASGADYERLFRQVTSLVRVIDSTSTGGSTGGGGPAVSLELQSLYDRRDELLAEQEAANRRQLAMQLSQNVADLAGVQEMSFEQVASSLNFTLDQLAADMGMETDALMSYLTSLQASSYDLMDFADQYENGVTRIVNAILGIDSDRPIQSSGSLDASRRVFAEESVTTFLGRMATSGGHLGSSGGLTGEQGVGPYFLNRPPTLEIETPEVTGYEEDERGSYGEDLRTEVRDLKEKLAELLSEIKSSSASTADSMGRIAVASDSRVLSSIAESPRTVLMRTTSREVVR